MAFDELKARALALEREIADGPIVPMVTPEAIRSHLQSRYDFSTPLVLDDVIADVERMLRAWQVHVTHPRYFGLFNPSVTTASIVADAITAMFNPQLAAWRTSPAPNEIERHTLAWLAAKFGLPPDSAANFTTGGAEANLSAVVLALTRAAPGYAEHGLRHLSGPPTIYLTSEAHHSFNKIVHMAGLGRASLRVVGTDSDLRMDVTDLIRRIDEDRKRGDMPLMVVATAGTTAAGAIDPLEEVAGACAAANLWFHVDAAWGGAAILSPRLSRCLDGIARADSITCDAHKWFSVPMGAGMFFCRYATTVAEAFRADTSYMPPKTPGLTVDPYTSSVQWSRRFIGLKLFMALAHYGESGYVEMIDHQARMGDVLRDALRHAGWTIVNTTPLPLVCFTRQGLNADAFLARLHEKQIAWMSQVRLGDGPPVLRACITSIRTTEADIQSVVREMSTLSYN